MTSKLPLVSIVTPSYNQAQFIEQTILSVKGQAYPNLEHLIFDGGSTDGTVEILKQYENTYDLKWISQPDNGQSDALNKGFAAANGDIVGWLNSDDTYMPNTVSTVVDALGANSDVGWVYGDGYWIDEKGSVLSIKRSGPYSYEDLLCREMYITQPATFFRREVFDKVGFLDEEIHTTMDYDFFLRIGLYFDAEYIPQVLATRRLHSDAKTVDNPHAFYQDAIKMLDKFFERADLPNHIYKFKQHAYARRNLIGAYNAFRAKDMPLARNLLWEFLKINPVLWGKETAIALVLFGESYLNISWISPGQARRSQEQDFLSTYGEVSVNWTEQEAPSIALMGELK